MTLRGRIALLTIAATVITVTLATVLAITAVNRVLTNQVDDQLLRRVNVDLGRQLVEEVTRTSQVTSWNADEQRVIVVDALVEGAQVPNVGISAKVPFEKNLVPDNVGQATLSTEEVDGVPVRIATARLADNVVVRSMRSIDDVQGTVRRIGTTVGALGGLVALLSALVVWLTVSRATRPVRQLAQKAEEAGATGDLSLLRDSTESISTRSDEVGELAKALKGMSTSVEEAREQQRRLVDNAAHELRTPLTSLRTNLEFLQQSAGRLDADAAREALTDAISESQSLGDLVNELVTLASDVKVSDRPFTPVRIDEVAREAVSRAERRSGRAIDFVVAAEEPTVMGDVFLLDRAVGNLLGNATKFAAAPAPIRVTVNANSVTVEDGGPGIPVDQRNRATERFWRAPESRGLPGSGLGLSIVNDIAAAHGGTITIADSSLGGARVTLWLPLLKSD